ncbi:MAG TPA: DUF5667 domain-containing protein [Longimicrobiales bacterium]|nr:DUF5667 domain-containing protein [Longimicrobiales bacterium]
MRREVLARVEPRSPGFGDHLYNILTVLAAPAPYLVRAAVSGVLVISLLATASVASADALPDEPLYALKVASEQVRLALAQSPEDRAVVWLSMAEHRLAEAERLAVAGREPEALVAASAYGTQLAEAAAELASIERLQANGPTIVARLRARLADQQARASDIAERLRTGTASAQSAPAFDTVASAPPAEASGTISELIAEHAASVTDQVAAAAAQRAQDEGVEETAAEPTAAAPPVVEAPPARVAPARPATAPRVAPPAAAAAQSQGIGNVTLPDPTPVATAAAQSEEGEDQGATATRKGTPTTLEKLAEVSRQWKAAIEKIKQQQQKAREAQQKAKERGKKTPPPAGQRSRDEDDD